MKKNAENLSPVIGMEVHVELRTDSKMFCGCPADHFGVAPNTHTCPVCLGLPGALPVPNKKAVDWTIMIGLALNSQIAENSKFDRKHYFYPDLPKGYQISQYDEPIAVGGYIETTEGKVGITRVHIEEDTGKLVHKKLDSKNVSLVDFNRSGVPLVEIVTEPDIHSAAQAKEVTQKLQQMIRFLCVTDADMEKGSMRLEANISWGLDLGYKVEVKNLNSFRFVERAIDYELTRQKEILDKGETPKQETRGWSEKENKTLTQRHKETAADYRYFPEPDIPPMEFTGEYIEEIKSKLPVLPGEKKSQLVKEYGIREDYAEILVSTREMVDFIEIALELAKEKSFNANTAVSAIINQKVDVTKVDAQEFVNKLVSQKSGQISDVQQVSEWVEKAISENPKAVEDIRSGKPAEGVLIGAVMKLSQGKVDPTIARKILEEKLEAI